MKGQGTELTKEQRAEIQALEGLPDDRINTSEVPEILDWSDARRGVFYRPVKQQITLRLDSDVVSWCQDTCSGRPGLSNGHQPRSAGARAEM